MKTIVTHVHIETLYRDAPLPPAAVSTET